MESRIHMRFGRIFLFVCLGLVLWSGLIVPVRALEPPDRVEAEKIRKILALKGPLSAAQQAELADVKRRMQNAQMLIGLMFPRHQEPWPPGNRPALPSL